MTIPMRGVVEIGRLPRPTPGFASSYYSPRHRDGADIRVGRRSLAGSWPCARAGSRRLMTAIAAMSAESGRCWAARIIARSGWRRGQRGRRAGRRSARPVWADGCEGAWRTLTGAQMPASIR